MLLNDIGKSPDSTLKKVNHHLESNYGFKISEEVSDHDLVAIMEQVQDEILDLKIKGQDAKTSPEISKRMLVLEGLRNLREFAIVRLQSPKYDSVIENLTNFVTDMFEITATPETSQRDFENAVRSAMDEYRSSRYRFPDDLVEQKVRQGAMGRIQGTIGQGMGDVDMRGRELGEGDPWGNTPQGGRQRDTAMGGHAASAPTTAAGKHAARVLDNPSLSLVEPDQSDVVPMIRDKSGRMVPDPFKAQAAARKKGIVMKEENLVKNLRRLLETEVSQAEVMMAAKGFATELQEMVEKIGRLQNEDLPPVVDQMRETYGQESASAFQTQIYGAMQGVMDALFTAKTQVDDAVSNMAATGSFSAGVDMDKPMDPAMDMNMDPNAMDVDPAVDGDLDNLAADLDAEDEFGGADGEEPLGRAKKMESLQSKVAAMKTLVERARKLKEAKAR